MSAIITRRRLLATASAAAAGGVASVLPLGRQSLAATPTIIVAESRTIEVLGKPATVFGLRQPNGSFGFATEVGKPFRVRLENRVHAPTLIHWHGLAPPYHQDGVPDLSAPLIEPGGAADYDFPLTFPGTFWMHAHTLQEQRMMAAPLIIHDPADAGRDEQEAVVMLHDFSFKSAEEILAGLRKKATGGMGRQPHPMAGMDGMRGMSMEDAGDHQGSAMGGMPMDLNDVEFDAFLTNDRTLADPEVVRVEQGGRILLRVINGAVSSNFVIDLGQLTGTLVAVDGHQVRPMTGAAFPIAMAQRLDIRIELPNKRGAWPVLAALEGEARRTGIVLANTGALIAKTAEHGGKPIPAMDFSLERSLCATDPLPLKGVDLVHRIELTGSMSPYRWGMNGKTFEEAKPYRVAAGQRVEILYVNKTMMSHPMHLHGHAFQVVAINGHRFAGAVRDTVLVPPRSSVTVAFDANNRGRWAMHCHNLYHMAAGMMGEVRYEGIT